jgi:hypothetical protein
MATVPGSGDADGWSSTLEPSWSGSEGEISGILTEPGYYSPRCGRRPEPRGSERVARGEMSATVYSCAVRRHCGIRPHADARAANPRMPVYDENQTPPSGIVHSRRPCEGGEHPVQIKETLPASPSRTDPENSRGVHPAGVEPDIADKPAPANLPEASSLQMTLQQGLRLRPSSRMMGDIRLGAYPLRPYCHADSVVR